MTIRRGAPPIVVALATVAVVATGEAVAADLPAPARAAVFAALGRDDAAYQVRRGVRIANRRHGLEARFGSDEVRVRSGRAAVRLSLAALGRGGALQRVGAGARSAAANRVSYRRPGVTEWYVNGALGLEQGFTLTRRPAGDGGAVTLALRLAGNLRPRLDADRRGLALLDRRGSQRLAYRGLWAADATGRELRASLALARGRVLVRVEDADARYPLTIDPYFQAGKLTASDGAPDDYFGIGLAMDGDVIVVGARDDDIGANVDQGTVHVFVKPVSGWANATETARLTSSDGATNDGFGSSVAIDGDTIVIGARYKPAVYVYEKPPGGWVDDSSQNAKFTVPSACGLGSSVDIDGNTIVAGDSCKDSGGGPLQGSAHVWERPVTGWANATQAGTTLLHFTGAATDFFGAPVRVSGDYIVAGVQGDDRNGAADFDQGSVSVFKRPVTGWNNGGIVQMPTTELVATDGGEDHGFGWSVDIDGNTIAVGSNVSGLSGFGHGSAYVFHTPAPGEVAWTQRVKLAASDGSPNNAFGWSIALSGNTLVVGARGATAGAVAKAGAAYVFTNPGTGWENATQTAKLAAADAATDDEFAQNVAITPTAIVASMTAFETGRGGAAYVFPEDSVAPLPPASLVVAPGSPANANAPAISGAAEPASTVRLYATADCSGSPLAQGSAAQFALPGITVNVPDNSTTRVYATATDLAGNVSACSPDPLVYLEDSAAPAAPGVNGSTRVTVGASARYVAILDDGSGSGVDPNAVVWTGSGGLSEQRGTTVDYRFPAVGSYTLRLNATDRAGNVAPEGSITVTVDPAPVADADGDGVLPPADCDDANKNIRPGAVDIPANGIDEDCDKVDAIVRIDSAIKNRWAYSTTFAVAVELRVIGVPNGATVEVRCSGPKPKRSQRKTHGCPFTSRKFKPDRKGVANLLRPFRGRRLLRRTVVEIRITQAGKVGKVVRYTVVRRKVPPATTLCLFPGGSKPRAC